MEAREKKKEKDKKNYLLITFCICFAYISYNDCESYERSLNIDLKLVNKCVHLLIYMISTTFLEI